jgi:hypothetical protein
MSVPIRLPGLRGESPAAALALYGISHLLGEEATVSWVADERGAGWCAEVTSSRTGGLDELCRALVDAVVADPLSGLRDLAKDVNELTPKLWSVGLRTDIAVARLVAGLCCEAPLRQGERVALSPICVYSFGTRGTLFGNAVKQDEAIDVKSVRALLTSPWTPTKGCNTLGFDPGARRQDGAIMGPDPSADGVRGVPGLVPLVLRGLAAVAPMPHPTRAQGGAFARGDGRVEFRWPIFTTPVARASLSLVVARDWMRRSPAQCAAAGIEAVFAAVVLRAERRLSLGRRVA